MNLTQEKINSIVRKKSQPNQKFPNLQYLCCSTQYQMYSKLNQFSSIKNFLSQEHLSQQNDLAHMFTAALHEGINTPIFIGLSQNFEVIGDYYHPCEQQRIRQMVKEEWSKIKKIGKGTQQPKYKIDFVPVKQYDFVNKIECPQQKVTFRKLIRIKVYPQKDQLYFTEQDQSFSVLWVKNNNNIIGLRRQEIYNYIHKKYKQKQIHYHYKGKCQEIKRQVGQSKDVPFIMYENNFIIITQLNSLDIFIEKNYPDYFCVKPYRDYQRQSKLKIWFISFPGNEQKRNQLRQYLKNLQRNIQIYQDNTWRTKKLGLTKSSDQNKIIYPYPKQKRQSQQQMQYFSFTSETQWIFCYVYFRCFKNNGRVIIQ